MADWNLAYDYIAAFLLLLILIWYMTGKRIPLKAHRVFLLLVTMVFFSTALEITATHIALNLDVFSEKAMYISVAFQNLSLNLVGIILAYYILELGYINGSNVRIVNTIFNVLLCINIVCAAVAYMTGTSFSFENGRFIPGTINVVCYIAVIAIVLISFIILVFNAKSVGIFKSTTVLFNVICSIVGVVMQVKLCLPVLNLMLTALCLTLFYYQQNPGNVMDSVTNQFNRKFMGDYINTLFQSDKRFTVIALAMDDFKFINKTYGVDNGDNLLYQIGSFLEALKFNKTVFRFGSDQFCVILKKNTDEAAEVIDAIHERFKHPWYSESQVGIMMSASICCIECPRDASDYGELIEVLDYSMSVAKKTSKGKTTMAGDVNLDRIKQDKAVEKAVKQAMDRDELQVYYQPIYSVSKGVYNSAEALVRLHDDELGWISPEIFIPIAEKNGLIIEMGEMILTKVCRFIHDFKLKDTTVEYVEVNISPVQLMQQNFADRVKAIMDTYDVKPEQINIEITETATMNSSGTVSANIEKLLEYGISFSLDDYGSGNANIDYINHMPFKIIKLDKYIIWDSFKNNKAGITLEYTIGMLNALQLYIVAEGVETEEMKNHLVNIGCHYMQGWYYSKAVSDNEFMNLIANQGQ